MEKKSLCMALALALMCAGMAFVAYSWDPNRGLLGNIVSGTGDVAGDIADVPENVVTGKYGENNDRGQWFI